jgi:hypothetical protein
MLIRVLCGRMRIVSVIAGAVASKGSSVRVSMVIVEQVIHGHDGSATGWRTRTTLSRRSCSVIFITVQPGARQLRSCTEKEETVRNEKTIGGSCSRQCTYRDGEDDRRKRSGDHCGCCGSDPPGRGGQRRWRVFHFLKACSSYNQ